MKSNHNLLQSRFPSPLTNPINSNMHLSGTSLHPSQRISHSHTKIIVTMNTQRDLHRGSDFFNEFPHSLGNHNPNRVRNVNSVSSSVLSHLAHALQKAHIRSSGVH